MQMEDTRKISGVKFKDICFGNCFSHPHPTLCTTVYYQKITLCEDGTNAITQPYGAKCIFDLDETVTPVKMKLLIID